MEVIKLEIKPKGVLKQLQKYPIMAAVRDLNDLKEALESEVECIFLMTGDLMSINKSVLMAKNYNKLIFIHLDLVKGLAKDKHGVRYIAKNVQPHGIVTTKKQLIMEIKKNNILAIHQLFVFDSQALESGIENVKYAEPDLVEIMPALIPGIMQKVSSAVHRPVVAAGLVETFSEVKEILTAGVLGVVSSKKELWKL